MGRYLGLCRNGFSLNIINYNVSFVDVSDSSIHTNNIERLCRDFCANITSNNIKFFRNSPKKYMCEIMFLAKSFIDCFEQNI